MKNYVQRGQTLDLPAPYAVTAGNGMLVGSIFAVATCDASSGATVAAETVGVFDLPKASGAVTAGAKIYWDNTEKEVTTTASGNSLIGGAVQAAASGDSTARVRLNGVTV